MGHYNVMHTAICIGQIQPTHCQCLVLGLSLIGDGGELQLMLSAAGSSRQECRWVEVLVEEHELQPAIAQKGGEDFADAWC